MLLCEVDKMKHIKFVSQKPACGICSAWCQFPHFSLNCDILFRRNCFVKEDWEDSILSSGALTSLCGFLGTMTYLLPPGSHLVLGNSLPTILAWTGPKGTGRRDFSKEQSYAHISSLPFINWLSEILTFPISNCFKCKMGITVPFFFFFAYLLRFIESFQWTWSSKFLRYSPIHPSQYPIRFFL